MRFVAVQEPTDSWAVFDKFSSRPAEYAGRVFIGLTLREARWLTALANNLPEWPECSRPAARLELVRSNSNEALPAPEKHNRTAS